MTPAAPAHDLHPRSSEVSSPWLGLASFTEEASPLFHGRNGEIADLALRVRRKQLTVLFGQSGLGKTSLVRAGLVPALRSEGYGPVYLRLHYEPEAPPPAEQIKQEVLRATVVATNWPRPDSARDGDGRFGGAQSAESLWEFFHHRDDRRPDEGGRPLTPLLICDQFEEIFTLAQSDDHGRGRARAFLTELADLVENRVPLALEQDETATARFDFGRADYRVLIVLREDYLAHLEGLRDLMPSITQNRVRLTRMTGAQALEAVLRPGAGLVGEEVARAIVGFVAGGAEIERAEIEPSLLSLVCRELDEARRARGAAEISADLLAGSRETILAEFYERAIADQPPAVRAFIEDHLLTESGFRESVAEERVRRAFADAAAPGALVVLVDRRLLRIEERLDVRRVELTHDVLCGIVAASRDTRHLREARERSARELAASEARAQSAHRALVRARAVATGAIALALIAIASAVFGYLSQRRARAAESRAATARERAAQLATFVMTDLRPGLEDRGGLKLLRASTEAAIRYYDSLPVELRSLASDRALADALALMAVIHALSGEPSEKAAAWARALALRQAIAARHPDDAKAAAQLLQSESYRPWSEGDTRNQIDAPRRRANIERWRKLLARFPSSPEVKAGLANELRAFAFDANDPWGGMYLPDEAMPAVSEACALVEELGAMTKHDREFEQLQSTCKGTLGWVMSRAGRYDEALHLFEQTRDTAEAALQRDPGNLRLRLEVANALFALETHLEGRSLEAAVPVEREVRERFRILMALDPANQGYARGFAEAHRVEAFYLAWGTCLIEPAREAFRRWDALLEPFVESDENVRKMRYWISGWEAHLAGAAGNQADVDSCMARMRERFALHESRLPNDPVMRRQAHLSFLTEACWVFRRTRRWSELEQTARDVRNQAEAGLQGAAADDPELTEYRTLALAFLGIAQGSQAPSAEALQTLDQAMNDLRERPCPPTLKPIAVALRPFGEVCRANVLIARGDRVRAREILTALEEDIAHEQDSWGLKWSRKESLAAALVTHASALDADDTANRSELLDRAWALLDTPEAEGRITVDGKETKARIAALRTEPAARP